MSSNLPAIGVFSGAGGLDLGVQEAGADLRLAVEPDTDSGKTLLTNASFFPNAELYQEPISDRTKGKALLEAAGLKRGEVAILVGGPPCQPFSKSGYWLEDRRLGISDPRASLIGQFARLIRAIRPESFILENVPSLEHPTNKIMLDLFLDEVKRAGYRANANRLHAVEYGVPQTRTRLFVTGIRGRRGSTAVPKKTNWWRSDKKELAPPETAGKWIAHLDKPDRNVSPSEQTSNGTWGKALAEIPPGNNYKALTAWAGHPNPTFVAESKYWSFLLKLSPRRPSWTIQAQPGPWVGPFHWTSRRLRVAEMAALQTFPEDYVFEGERRSVIRQIGNAVPPLLAYRVANELLAQVAGTTLTNRGLLSYVQNEGYAFDEAFSATKGHRW